MKSLSKKAAMALTIATVLCGNSFAEKLDITVGRDLLVPKELITYNDDEMSSRFVPFMSGEGFNIEYDTQKQQFCFIKLIGIPAQDNLTKQRYEIYCGLPLWFHDQACKGSKEEWKKRLVNELEQENRTSKLEIEWNTTSKVSKEAKRNLEVAVRQADDAITVLTHGGIPNVDARIDKALEKLNELKKVANMHILIHSGNIQ